MNPNLELLIRNIILILALARIIQVNLSLNLWRFVVSVFPFLLCCDITEKFFVQLLRREEIYTSSLLDTFGISSFKSLKILRELPRSQDCLFICSPVSWVYRIHTQSLMVLSKLRQRHSQAYEPMAGYNPKWCKFCSRKNTRPQRLCLILPQVHN